MKLLKCSFLLIISCVMLSCASFRNKGLDAFYKEYNQEITSLRIPKMLYQFTGSHKELKPLTKYLKATRVVSIENISNKMLRDLDKALENDRYEEFISINSEGDLITILAAEKKDRITHIVLKIKDEDEINLIQTRVDLPVDKFQEILSSLN